METPTVCLISEIYQDGSFFFQDADSSKQRKKSNFNLIDICLLQKMLRIL
jgi:hypothetical protein